MEISDSGLSTNFNESATRKDQAVAFYKFQRTCNSNGSGSGFLLQISVTVQLEGFNRQPLQAIPSLPTTCTMAKSAGRRPTAGLSAIQG